MSPSPREADARWRPPAHTRYSERVTAPHASKPAPFAVFAFAAALAFAPVAPDARAGEQADPRVAEWLAQPGVRAVAVEFYATWCKPCMEAMPRWRALAEKYHDQGLRIVVVNTQDPEGGCRTLGFTPDATVCDLEGQIGQAFGLQGKLPAAYLWSWQGNLLVEKGHIGEVERALERYMREAPRAAVEGGPGVGAEILAALRDRLADDGKIRVVASAEEAATLEAARRAQQGARYDDKLQCELGREVPPNTLLRASRVGEGKSAALSVGLFDVASGCLLQSASAPWGDDPRRMAQEAVAKLHTKLRRATVQRPESAREGAVSREVVSNPEADGWRPTTTELAMVTFTSAPPGARVEIDGAVTCAATPCKRPLEPGLRRVRMSLDRHLAREEALRVDGDRAVAFSLEANAVALTIETKPPGAPLRVDGEAAGPSPLKLELAAGPHRVEIADPCYEHARADVTLARGTPKSVSLKAVPRVAGLRVELTGPGGDPVEADVSLDGKPVGRTWKNLTVPVCGKVVEVATDRGTFREEVTLRAKELARVEGALAEPSEDDETCPFVKAQFLKRCEADRKKEGAACEAALSEESEACAATRRECEEQARVTRGIGPAAQPTCGEDFSRCAAAAKRTRAGCVATSNESKGACVDGVEVRAARCATTLAGSSKERKVACQAQCRTEATAAVNACQRPVNAEKRTLAAKLEADRAECHANLAVCRRRNDGGCGEVFGECLQLAEYLANDAKPSAQSCVEEAQRSVLPCLRACEAP